MFEGELVGGVALSKNMLHFFFSFLRVGGKEGRSVGGAAFSITKLQFFSSSLRARRWGKGEGGSVGWGIHGTNLWGKAGNLVGTEAHLFLQPLSKLAQLTCNSLVSSTFITNTKQNQVFFQCPFSKKQKGLQPNRLILPFLNSITSNTRQELLCRCPELFKCAQTMDK